MFRPPLDWAGRRTVSPSAASVARVRRRIGRVRRSQSLCNRCPTHHLVCGERKIGADTSARRNTHFITHQVLWSSSRRNIMFFQMGVSQSFSPLLDQQPTYSLCVDSLAVAEENSHQYLIEF